jgi:ABC-type transport system substrate-binding protein
MKKSGITVVLSSVALLGLFGLASAQTATAPTQTPETASVGSIKVPSSTTTYQALAKISLDEAVKAAQNHLGVSTGASSAQLGTENGYLIWEIVIGDQVVNVDAGDASILQTENYTEQEMSQEDSNGDDNEQEMSQEDSDENEADDSSSEAADSENESGLEDGN